MDHTLAFAEKHDTIGKNSFVALAIALAFFIAGVCRILNLAEVFAVFVGCLFIPNFLNEKGGVAFAWSYHGSDRSRHSEVVAALDLLLSVGWFMFFGLILPFHYWSRIFSTFAFL